MSETLSQLHAAVKTTLPAGAEVLVSIPLMSPVGTRDFAVVAGAAFVQEAERNIASGFAGLNSAGNLPLSLLDGTAATSGEVMTWSGAAWGAGAVAITFGTTSGTAAQGNDSRIVGAAQVANNLSDLASASAARTNLALGALATLNTLAPSLITQSGATTGQLLGWSGTAWAPTTVSAGSVALGTPPVLTASGTIDLSHPLTILNSTSAAITATLPNGTTDGQEVRIAALASSQAHTVVGQINEVAATFPLSSPNGGATIDLYWSTSRSSWYPRSYDGLEEAGDLTDISTVGPVLSTDTVVVTRSGTAYKTTPLAMRKGGAKAVALTDGTSIATDASLGAAFTVTLGGNRTLANPTNLIAGEAYAWVVTQDGTGSRTLAYGNLFTWPGGTAPTLSTAAGAVDTIAGVYDGTKLRCAIGKAFA